jgi:hypothetical protein
MVASRSDALDTLLAVSGAASRLPQRVALPNRARTRPMLARPGILVTLDLRRSFAKCGHAPKGSGDGGGGGGGKEPGCDAGYARTPGGGPYWLNP